MKSVAAGRRSRWPRTSTSDPAPTRSEADLDPSDDDADVASPLGGITDPLPPPPVGGSPGLGLTRRC